MTDPRIVQYPGPGCVVEFMQGNKPLTAWVLEEHGGKLRLLTLNKRETKLPVGRLLPWSGPRHPQDLSRQDILAALERHQGEREELMAAIDAGEIWSLAQGELESATAPWFAELLWEDPDVEHVAAMGRALLECKSHFKFRPPEFEVYTEERVEARLAEQTAAQERERLAAAGQEFFKELWAVHTGRSKQRPAPPEPDLAARLEQLLRTRMAQPDDSESERLMRSMCAGLPEDQHLALRLAQAWNIVGPHHNVQLDMAAYEAGDAWSEEFSQEVEDLRARVAAMAQEPDPTPLVSVDSATTRDVDDAFFVRQENEHFRVRLALACPALGWEFGSPLDRAVAARATSLYLPEGVSHMLPESLGTDFFSLVQGQARPALVLDMDVDARGELTGCEPAFSWVRVAGNLTYEQVEAGFEHPGQGPCPDHEAMLALGLDVAKRLRAARLGRGAVVVDREDPEISLKEEDGALKVLMESKEPTPGAQLLVSEMMILANSAVALWAGDKEVTLLHRTQDVRIGREFSGVWSEPQDIHKAVKALGPSILEARPRPHASLGVAAYSPFSSPLRRYPDFLNAAQILAALTTGEPRWDKDALAGMLPTLCSRLEAVGRVQRFRPRYWKLVYFKQQPADARYPAVVIEEGPTLVTVSLPAQQIYLRGRRDLFGDKLYAGQRFSVRLGKIDPLNNDIQVMEALEE